MIRLGIIGATGSIGVQAMGILNSNRGRFQLKFATAHTRRAELESLTVNHGSHGVPELFVTSEVGSQPVLDAIHLENIDILLVASEGVSGLEYTYAAAKAGVPVALANKESLVLGGHILMPIFAEMGGGSQMFGGVSGGGVSGDAFSTMFGSANTQPQAVRPSVIPVDSEHSAIFQSLMGQDMSSVAKIVLTASGGPFRKFTPSMMAGITREMALFHPNWSMGQKITVDSSTMMNKGLELIEARYLFDMPSDKIDVVVHGESIVHSYVVFKDGATMAQMGIPSMLAPIAFALGYPHRLETGLPTFDMLKYPTLSFEAPDTVRFPALGLAQEALKVDKPCVYIGLNAANDTAVAGLLNDTIGYNDIARVVAHILDSEFLYKTDTSTMDGVQSLVDEVQHKSTQYMKKLR